MVALNYTSVNNRHRHADISRDGFDRDLSIDGDSRPLMTLPAGFTADINLHGDTTTTAGRRSLARRGDTFAASHQEERGAARNPSNCLAYCTPITTNDSKRGASMETRRRYDLKHAVVRMLRTGLKDDERSHAVCGCGHAAYDRDEDGGLRFQIPVHRNGNSRAWVSGVYRCKSGWLCPTCAPAVARKRQQQVQAVVENTTKLGGVFVMGLVTVAHSKDDRLADLKKMVMDSFAAARRLKGWKRAEKTARVAGVLVAPEVTYGEFGWHFHIHFGLPCLLANMATISTRDVTDAEKRAAARSAAAKAAARRAKAAGLLLIRYYRKQIAKRGGTTVSQGQGVQVAASPEKAADYIAKGTAWELAGGTAHKDEAKGQTIWQIVEDAEAGDIGAYARFHEYTENMPGTRSCIITPRLRKNLGLEADDEEDTAEPGEQIFEDNGAVVGHLDTPVWQRFLWLKLAGTFLCRIESISGPVTADLFDKLVAETTADADHREGIITRKRVAKVQRNATSDADRHAEIRRIITRNIAYHVLQAAERHSPSSINSMIEQRIASLRADGHPEAAMPIRRGVLAALSQLRSAQLRAA